MCKFPQCFTLVYYNHGMMKTNRNSLGKAKQYWKEILLLLVVKAVLLTGLWYECFRTPLVLDDKTAGEHILR